MHMLFRYQMIKRVVKLINGLMTCKRGFMKFKRERVNAAQAKIKSKLLLEGAKRNRDIAYANFRQLCLKFEGIIAMNIRTESIERERSIIQTQFRG